MPAWGSLTLLEAIWILVALAGLAYSSKQLRRALAQRHFIHFKNLNGGRRIVTDRNVRQESLRLFGLTACLLLGVYAASPPSVQAPFVGWLAPLLLVCIMTSLALGSFLDEQSSIALQQMLAIMDGARKRNAARAEHAAGEHPA